MDAWLMIWSLLLYSRVVWGENPVSCHSWITAISQTKQRQYSQSVQDGILQIIFEKIGLTNKFFVEFGFGYTDKAIETEADMDQGASGLNTRNLHKQGWKGVYFDADIENPKFNIHKVILTFANIVEVFQNASVPNEVDYVSIDVDSVDIWLLFGLLQSNIYHPRVISIEYNANFGHYLIAHQQEWHAWQQDSIYGTSVGSVELIAKLYGYHIVHVMPDGLDAFLVRDDVIKEVCDLETVPTLEELTPFLPFRSHHTCSLQNAHRIVDFPLAIIGQLKEAHRRGLEELNSLNAHYFKENLICNTH